MSTTAHVPLSTYTAQDPSQGMELPTGGRSSHVNSHNKDSPVSQVILDSVNLTAPTITPTNGHLCFFCSLAANDKGMNMTHQSL